MEETPQNFSEDDFNKKPDIATPVTELEKPTKKNKARFILIPAITIGVLVWGAIGYYYLSSIVNDIDPQVRYSADILNKACPIMVGKTTRLESVVALPGKTMLCKYTFLSVEPGTTTDTASAKERLKLSLVTHANANPFRRITMGEGVTFLYKCFDKKDNYLFSLTLTSGDVK